MKATRLVQVLMVLVFSIRFALAQAAPSESLTAASRAPLTKPVATEIAAADNEATGAKADGIGQWLITDENSHWSVEEEEIMQQVLQDTFGALVANGIDGMALLDGYRFRHETGRYVDEVDGRMAKIDHNVQEITVSDTAFTVLRGFAIYHELGHAVDYRLERQMSESFHEQTGGGMVVTEAGEQWETAANYWIRLAGRDDREEAAADAFAVLVMVTHAGLSRPVFAHQPVTTDYAGISAALSLALQNAKA